MIDIIIKLAYKIVYSDICNNGEKATRILNGFYSGKDDDDAYMFGVSNVIEYIAMKANKDDDFSQRFVLNMIKCKESCKKVFLKEVDIDI